MWLSWFVVWIILQKETLQMSLQEYQTISIIADSSCFLSYLPYVVSLSTQCSSEHRFTAPAAAAAASLACTSMDCKGVETFLFKILFVKIVFPFRGSNDFCPTLKSEPSHSPLQSAGTRRDRSLNTLVVGECLPTHFRVTTRPDKLPWSLVYLGAKCTFSPVIVSCTSKHTVVHGHIISSRDCRVHVDIGFPTAILLQDS